MSYLEKAKLKPLFVDGCLHSLYAVFWPGEKAARTLQVGPDTDCHAYVDVDESDFPIALELRGWKQMPQPASRVTEMSREKTIKALLGLAFELIRHYKGNAESLSRISKVAEEAASELIEN